MSAADALTKQVGPLPMGVWLLVGAGGLVIAHQSRKRDEPQLTREVQQVPVPVGAIASPDNAPVVITPIFRLPEIINNITLPGVQPGVQPDVPPPPPVLGAPVPERPAPFVPPRTPSNADRAILGAGVEASVFDRILAVFVNRGLPAPTVERLREYAETAKTTGSFDPIRDIADERVRLVTAAPAPAP